MKLLERLHHEQKSRGEGNGSGRTTKEKAPQPQPEHHEPMLADPTPTKLSRRDYLAIVKRSFRELRDDHLTNIAAALAYYAFRLSPRC